MKKENVTLFKVSSPEEIYPYLYKIEEIEAIENKLKGYFSIKSKRGIDINVTSFDLKEKDIINSKIVYPFYFTTLEKAEKGALTMWSKEKEKLKREYLRLENYITIFSSSVKRIISYYDLDLNKVMDQMKDLSDRFLDKSSLYYQIRFHYSGDSISLKLKISTLEEIPLIEEKYPSYKLFNGETRSFKVNTFSNRSNAFVFEEELPVRLFENTYFYESSFEKSLPFFTNCFISNEKVKTANDLEKIINLVVSYRLPRVMTYYNRAKIRFEKYDYEEIPLGSLLYNLK